MTPTGSGRAPVRAAILGTGLLAEHLHTLSGQDDVDIVGVGTTTADKIGRSTTRIWPSAGTEVIIQSVDDVLERDDVDVVLHAGPQNTVWDTFDLCAARGLDALTSAGAFSTPDDDPASERARSVHDAASASGSRLVAAGIFPGFTADVLPLLFSRILPGAVDIDIDLVSDVSSWSEGVLRNEIGIGSPLREPDLPLFDYVVASANLIVDGIGKPAEEWTRDARYLTSGTRTAIGPVEVEAGDIAGFALRVDARLDDRNVSVRWTSTLGDVSPGATIRIASATHGHEMTMRVTETPAYPATAARLLNAVRPLRALPAGLRRTFELPIAAPRETT